MKFNTRSFVSLLLSFTFLVSLVSGVVMWIHTSIIFGLGVWKYVHMYVSFLMAITAIVHFSLNWQVYLGYWRRCASGDRPVRELTSALAITLAAVIALGAIAPTKRGGPGGPGGPDRANGRAAQSGRSMPSDIAAMSVMDVAKNSGQSVDKIVEALKREGIHVHDTADTLKKIAEHNEKKPQEVCKIVQASLPGPKDRK